MLWVRSNRRSAVNVSNAGILMGGLGVVVTAPMVAVSPVMLFLTGIFLAWPILTWRKVRRDGKMITVRSAFGSKRLAAGRCTIGYRFEGGSRWAEYKVYLTDGVSTANLAEHLPYGTRGTERDVARLTALLLDPKPGRNPG